MAKKIRLDLSQFKSSGVYTLEFDASESIIVQPQTIKLVVGFSKQGPFNTLVFLDDPKNVDKIFGEVDPYLERKGSFFHRSLKTALQTGPCFALNLLKLNNDETSVDVDKISYRSLSLDSTEKNGLLTNRLYSSFYNKQKFWNPDTEYFLATRSIADQSKILNFTNLGKSPISILVKKADTKGFEITAKEWFGVGKVPAFMREYDYIKDYFIDVLVVEGDFGPSRYASLAVDPIFSAYFDVNGLKKDKLDAFLNLPEITYSAKFTGTIIPDFTDGNGVNQFIENIINNNTTSTGLFCSINKQALDDIDINDSKIDLLGHNLISSLGDSTLESIDFLSYRANLKQDFTYNEGAFSKNEVDSTLAGISVVSAGSQNYTVKIDNVTTTYPAILNNIQSGKSGILAENTSTTTEVKYKVSSQYNSSTDSILLESNVAHNLTTDFTGTAASGSFTVPSGGFGTGNSISINGVNFVQGTDFATGATDYATAVNLTNAINANVTIGTVVTSTHNYANGANGGGIITITADTIGTGGNAITLAVNAGSLVRSGTTLTGGLNAGVINMKKATGVSGFAFFLKPDKTSTITTATDYIEAYEFSQLYLDFAAGRITNGDRIVWNNASVLTPMYLKFTQTSDADSFSIVRVEGYSDAALTTAIDLNFTLTTYRVDGVTSESTATQIYVQSLIGSLNERVDVTTTTSTNKVIVTNAAALKLSVGDYLVSDANGQDHLTRIVSISKNSVNDAMVTTQEKIKILAGTQVERFRPIETFVDRLDFTPLKGFELKAKHMPNNTNARMNEILNVMTETNIYNSLIDSNIVTFRYIVDTFNHGLEPQSKAILAKLAKDRGKALAILNLPSIKEFADSTDPRFTDAVTASDPKPILNTKYIVSGGNLDLNPSFTYSLPDEVNGAKYCGFFGPNLIVRDGSRKVSVPPAAYVSNLFVQKFINGTPFAIVAGKKRGVIADPTVERLEYDFLTSDRDNLEPFGINPIINKKGQILVFSNQTGFQKTNSALNNLHVRDLLITLEEDVESILSEYLFEFNDSTVRLEITKVVESYLEKVLSDGGIQNFDVIMDRSNNNDDVINQNSAIIDIRVEPTRGIHRFIARFTVSKAGGVQAGGFAAV